MGGRGALRKGGRSSPIPGGGKRGNLDSGGFFFLEMDLIESGWSPGGNGKRKGQRKMISCLFLLDPCAPITWGSGVLDEGEVGALGLGLRV